MVGANQKQKQKKEGWDPRVDINKKQTWDDGARKKASIMSHVVQKGTGIILADHDDDSGGFMILKTYIYI